MRKFMGLTSENSTEVALRPLVFEKTTSVRKSSIPKAVPQTNHDNDNKLEATSAKDRATSKYSKLVQISDFYEYVKEAIETEELERQHGVFPRGQTKPWIHGTKPQNKSKNRYGNLAAYDHSRVKLKILHDDPFSDYINANYIDGYNFEKAYIATQGPKATTLDDFWRMIWEQNVQHIIMIANLVEGGKKKVEKYWPEINETRQFDKILVEYVKVDVMANYEIRHFNVSCNNEKRKVQQMHFLSWPDHGVPLYTRSLAPFLKKMLTLPQGRSPIVVHCSAGVGRTGSLILCDICLRMAAREGKVDPFYYLDKIREQRVNMVDNGVQYKLVHLALLQCLVAPETGIECDETMKKTTENIIAELIDAQMQYIDDSMWQDKAMQTENFCSDLPIVDAKNRFKHIIPDPFSRISLSPYPPSDQSSAYINAVSVDGFSSPFKFIVTQNPLPNTVGDFWRLVEETKITTIVSLNELDPEDDTSCKFYPMLKEHTMKPIPPIKIICNGREDNTYYKVYKLTLVQPNQVEDDQHIKVIEVKGWQLDMLHPDNPVNLLMAYEEMNRLGRTCDRVLITCHDGARASGLFVAICFVIDQIKMEQLCDACLAVRTVRHSRKEFVREKEQLTFLYKSALDYVQQFDMYSNFSFNKNAL